MVNFFILGRTGQDVFKNVRLCSCTVTIIPIIFEWNLDFLDRFSKK